MSQEELRKEFETYYYNRYGTRMYCENQWRGFLACGIVRNTPTNDEMVEKVADAIQEQLPSLGLMSRANPLPNDFSSAKWAQDIAKRAAKAAIAVMEGRDA